MAPPRARLRTLALASSCAWIAAGCGGNAVIHIDGEDLEEDELAPDETGNPGDPNAGALEQCMSAPGEVRCVPWQTSDACPVGEVAAAVLLSPCSNVLTVACGPIVQGTECCYVVQGDAGLCG